MVDCDCKGWMLRLVIELSGARVGSGANWPVEEVLLATSEVSIGLPECPSKIQPLKKAAVLAVAIHTFNKF